MCKKMTLFIAPLVIVAPLLFFLNYNPSLAQTDGVAFLSVTKSGVQLKRSGSDMWVTVNVESVVGSGDRIRTQSSGEAIVTFITGDLTVNLDPNTEFYIALIQREDESYRISIEIPSGTTHQKVADEPSVLSSYEIKVGETSLVFQNSDFDLEVASSGETKVISNEGTVSAIASGQVVEISAGKGIRIDKDATLSAVLPVENFQQLDSALDGLIAVFEANADVQLNVRQGPSRDQRVVNTLEPSAITKVMGVSEDGQWYRVPYREGVFGWVSSEGINVAVDSTLLVRFPNEYLEALATSSTEAVTTPVPAVAAPTTTTTTAEVQASVYTDYSLEELKLVAAMNQWRIEQGLPPFKTNATLTRMARDQVTYLMSLSSLPNDLHRDAKGRYPRERAVSDDYKWAYYSSIARAAVGENAYAGVSADAAVRWWKSSELHRTTALSEGYREIGVAAIAHPFGYLYMTVFGSRPNNFPVMLDTEDNSLYLTRERYQYASGGDWINEVQEYQIVPNVLTQLEETKWQTWIGKIAKPSGNDSFALALRGNGRVVIIEVDPQQDVLVSPASLAAALAKANASGQSTNNTQSSSNNIIAFPTNTPSP